MNRTYAKLENNIVVDVISATPEFIESLRIMEIDGKTKHDWFDTSGCKNQPGVGSTYRLDIDAFVHPKPFENWIWDNTIYEWIPPIPVPDNIDKWFWDQTASMWLSEADIEALSKE